MARTFQIGEVVTLRPPCDCPGLWRQLAEQLKGVTFQVTGNAQTIGTAALVLQPWPGAEIYPSCRLAPAECLQLAPQKEAEAELVPFPLSQYEVLCLATDAISCINARLLLSEKQIYSASWDGLQLALEQALREAAWQWVG